MGNELKAYISVFNAEYMIEASIKSVLKVFPNLTVVDIGSEDNSASIAESLCNNVMRCGRMSGEEYTELKERLASSSKHAFWTDADEVWPETCLRNISHLLRTWDVVNGYWRNIKIEEGKVLVSSKASRGAVAWNTKVFRMHRPWPREKLSTRNPELNRKDVQVDIPELVWSWHGILLKISPTPDKKNRWKKRAERKDNFEKQLTWKELDTLPFSYTNSDILNPTYFEWYK